MTNQKTPPMGWNSWDCYGTAVNEEIVLANAEYMAKNLKQYGWEYVVVDIQWSNPTAKDHEYQPFAPLCQDAWGRLLPAVNRFPSAADGAGFAPLGKKIHDMGLKFGIHIMRGIPRQAAWAHTPVKGTDGITANQIANPNSVCRWNPDMYGVDPTKPGAQEYYDSIMELYASWGVDYIKVDDIANHYPQAEIEMLERAIDKTGRDIVFSISPGPAKIEEAEHLKQHVNMWRITDDFWDDWKLLYEMFWRADMWSKHTMRGHWPDADMLPIGPILQDYNKENWTKFTEDEQITMMTLWCIMRSPLMIGGEMTGFDAFTKRILTNTAVLEMGLRGHSAHQIWRRGEKGDETIAWMSTHEESGYFAALFNASELEKEIVLDLTEAGLPQNHSFTVTNLWTGETFDLEDGMLRAKVPVHGAAAFRIVGK